MPPVVSLGFLDRSRYYFFQAAPQLSSRGWVDPVPDPQLLRKSGSAGNRTQDLCICSQKLWPLDHIGGHTHTKLLATCLLAGSCWNYFSTLKMEVICSSETSVATQQTTRHHIPEDDTLHNHRCENLKSHVVSYRRFGGTRCPYLKGIRGWVILRRCH
jgi:hypothetical protein